MKKVEIKIEHINVLGPILKYVPEYDDEDGMITKYLESLAELKLQTEKKNK